MKSRAQTKSKPRSKVNPQRKEAFIRAIEKEEGTKQVLIETKADPKVQGTWVVRTKDVIYVMQPDWENAGEYEVIDTIDASELKPGETLRSSRLWGAPRFL